MTDEKPFYSVREFADLIGWPRRTVRYYLKKRLIKSKKSYLEKHKREVYWLIPREELVRWGLLEENETS